MPQKLTDSALLICDKGSTPTKLKVTSQDFFKVDGKLVATESDMETNNNIGSFGVCKITRGKCTQSIIKWQQTAQKDEINELKILTDKSTCTCVLGGSISVNHKGHNEFHEIE